MGFSRVSEDEFFENVGAEPAMCQNVTYMGGGGRSRVPTVNLQETTS